MFLQGRSIGYRVIGGITLAAASIGLATDLAASGNSGSNLTHTVDQGPASMALENYSVDLSYASLMPQAPDSNALARLRSYPLYRLRVSAFRSRRSATEK